MKEPTLPPPLSKEPTVPPVTRKVVSLNEVRARKMFEEAREAILRKAKNLGW